MTTIKSTSLTTTPTAIFTADGTNVITTMYYCNLDSEGAHTFSVWLVANGEDVSNVNLIYNNVSVVAKDTFVIDKEKIVLSNGDAIYAYANVDNIISATVSNFSQ